MAGCVGIVGVGNMGGQPLGPVAHAVFEQAARAGLAQLDDAALFRLLSRS